MSIIEDQLDLQAVHRVRDRLVARRTSVISQTRAFLLERGISFREGPYWEIDIREAPVAVRKEIVIGPGNWAFSCPTAKEPCEQIPSGRIVFDHLEGQTAGLKSEGHYELRTRSGTVEKGSFRVDCVEPCMP